MPYVRKVGDWDEAAKILDGLAERYRAALVTGLYRAGQVLRDETRKGIRSGAPGGETFAPLSELTIRTKGSSKPLIDYGDLLNSITYQVNKDRLWVFVGVLRTARSKRPDSPHETYLANIARVHEEGAVIPVTPKMRRFFFARWGIRLKASTTHIVIPARPFLRPTFRKYAPEVAKMFRQLVARVLKGERAK